jgi:hypothetical protein
MLHSSQKPWVDIFPYFHMVKHALHGFDPRKDHNWYKLMDILVLISRVQHYNELLSNFLSAGRIPTKKQKEKRTDKVQYTK